MKKPEQFTKGHLCKLLEDEAKEYRLKSLNSIKQNSHMNSCKNPKVSQPVIDAILVDFINYVATGQGIDLGLHTKHLVT